MNVPLLRLFVFVGLFCGPLQASVRRVVLFKFDGVNARLVEKGIATVNPQTGRSQLPWLAEIFGRQGMRFSNFFVRGISLSAPSWSELDTGRHAVIRGNVEYDRWTLRAYDYLNFFPFYFASSQKKQVDMPGAETLDDCGIPLLIDAFPPGEVWQSYQLYQRGNNWSIIKRSLPNHFGGRSPQQWLDEWQTGLELAGSVPQEIERQLTQALADNKIAYLDFFSGDYDHVAHLTNDLESQMRALQSLDALIGRIYTAARASSLGAETLFVVVSDHGMNTRRDVLSQGYSLVNWFNSSAGGGQHVITDRYPLSTFKIKGLDPFVHKVTNASSDSTYLKEQAQRYPTVLLDLDGNERAAVQLRSNDWNIAQLLLQGANKQDAPANVKAACREELRRWAEAHSTVWAKQKAVLQTGIDSLRNAAANLEKRYLEANRPWTKEELNAGLQLPSRRLQVAANRIREVQSEYKAYVDAVEDLMAMPPNAKDTLIPKKSLGDANSIYDFQNYVVGLSPGGIVLSPDGRIDFSRSFQRIDYISALQEIRVRNQVQKGMSNRPVDFIAVPLDRTAAERTWNEEGLLAAVWLAKSNASQAVVLYRQEATGTLSIRYVPVRNLRVDRDQSIRFDVAEWGPDLPLAIAEDPALVTPNGAEKKEWLKGWHGEREWFNAIAATKYSNGLIGLSELFRPLEILEPAWASSLPPADRASLVPFETLQRELTQPDFEIFAADHWNFNVRNFNPGGNHGGFFRESTRSVLMFAGSPATGVRAGLEVREPYDSLSFVPTLLRMMNRSLPGPSLPGEPIRELVSPAQ